MYTSSTGVQCSVPCLTFLSPQERLLVAVELDTCGGGFPVPWLPFTRCYLGPARTGCQGRAKLRETVLIAVWKGTQTVDKAGYGQCREGAQAEFEGPGSPPNVAAGPQRDEKEKVEG